MEGRNLTVRQAHFIDDEDGILTGRNDPDSVLTVIDSEFQGNGNCIEACAHGIYAGHIGLLRVIGSVFRDTHVGHHIKSRAYRTEIVRCDIQDRTTGTSSYLIDVPNGGDLVVKDTTLEKGINSSNHWTAINVGEEGELQPTRDIVIRGSRFTNDQFLPTIFLNNHTSAAALLDGNKLKGLVLPLWGSGHSQQGR
jgi:hypothetical protein